VEWHDSSRVVGDPEVIHFDGLSASRRSGPVSLSLRPRALLLEYGKIEYRQTPERAGKESWAMLFGAAKGGRADG
jgi:hypothetical protein